MGNRWGNSVTVADFILRGSKITADGDCSHEIKRCLLLGRKVMTNLDSILKSRDITLPKKGPSSQGHGFSSSHECMWELDCEESWAPKNWCFWTVVLEKTLESPLNCKETNQSILKEISPGCPFEVLMLRLKLQYLATSCEELTYWKRPWCCEGLAAGGEGEDRGWDGWMASLTWRIWACVNSGSWWWTGGLACCSSWGHKESDITERLN